MATVEFGTFLAFLSVPVITLFFMAKIRSWGVIGYLFFVSLGALSFIMLGGLALMMASDYDVVWSEVQAAYSYTQIDRDDMGQIITNSTITIPEQVKETPIITEYQNIWSYVFGGALIVFGLIYFLVMLVVIKT